MAKNEEFLKAIQSIYGDKQLSREVMSQLKRTWKQNPNFILSTAKEKDELKAKEASRQAYLEKVRKLGPAPIARSQAAITPMSKLNIPSQKERMEAAFSQGDMSAVPTFDLAFGEARKRGLKEFNWRMTDSNPSGRFNTELKPKSPTTGTNNSPTVGTNNSRTKENELYEKLNAPEEVEEYFDSADFAPVAINPPAVAENKPPFIEEQLTRAVGKAHAEGFAEGQKRIKQQQDWEELRRRRGIADFKAAHGFTPEGYKEQPSIQEVANKSIPFRQQGGTMGANDQELQKAFMAFLIEDAAAQGMQIQSEQDLQVYAQQLGEEGLKAKYQEFMQKMQGGVKAALGAKLNYLHKLKGNCPDGYEMVYMKEGGRFCPKCMEKASKAKDGEKLNKKKNAIADFKERKKQHINLNDTVNTKFGPRDLNGKTKYPKYDANKENYDFETRKRVQEKDEKSGKKVIGSACGSKLKKK